MSNMKKGQFEGVSETRVDCVPKLSSLLAAIGVKLIVPTVACRWINGLSLTCRLSGMTL